MRSQINAAAGLELKYCEQCGSLWVRRRGSDECYCARCARFLEEIPPLPRDNRRRGGSGPLRRRMRKQFREPGTELAPLEYVVANRGGDQCGERVPLLLPASLPAAEEQEAEGHDGL